MNFTLLLIINKILNLSIINISINSIYNYFIVGYITIIPVYSQPNF